MYRKNRTHAWYGDVCEGERKALPSNRGKKRSNVIIIQNIILIFPKVFLVLLNLFDVFQERHKFKCMDNGRRVGNVRAIISRRLKLFLPLTLLLLLLWHIWNDKASYKIKVLMLLMCEDLQHVLEWLELDWMMSNLTNNKFENRSNLKNKLILFF